MTTGETDSIMVLSRISKLAEGTFGADVDLIGEHRVEIAETNADTDVVTHVETVVHVEVDGSIGACVNLIFVCLSSTGGAWFVVLMVADASILMGRSWVVGAEGDVVASDGVLQLSNYFYTYETTTE